MSQKHKPILTGDEAARLIPNGAVVTVSSSAAQLVPDKVLAGIETRFLSAGLSNNLTVVFPIAVGDSFGTLGLDHLAHPGLITPEEVDLAKARSISLEITARKGHSLTNGHVAQMAIKAGASLVFNTDSHDPEDLLEIEGAKKILLGAGLNPGQIERVFQDAYRLAEKIL